MKINKKQLLELCLKKIEEKYQQGKRELWTHKNYIGLSEDITNTTKIYISPSSLKRLFGKVVYNYYPQIQTRNALAIYLGFKSWDDFTIDFSQNDAKITLKKLIFFTSLIIIAVLLILAAIIHFSYPLKFEASKNEGNAPLFVSFKYQLPFFSKNSYCIDYDKITDDKCQELNPNENVVNHTFIHSDVFHVYLKKEGKVVRTIPIVSTTNKWESIICVWESEEGFCKNLYSNENLKHKGILSVDTKTVNKYGFDTTDAYWIKHRFISDIGADGNSFSFEARFRNKSIKNLFDCPGVNFTIIGLENQIKIHFSSPGCIGSDDPRFEFSDKIILGKFNDMSAFEVNLENWCFLNLIVDGKNLKVFINNKEIYETKLNEDIGDIYGVIADIKGPGELDVVRFKTLDKLTKFEDTFD